MVLFDEGPQESLFLDENAEQKVQVSQYRDGKAVHGNVQIAGQEHKARHE
jgi:hypothetical protein